MKTIKIRRIAMMLISALAMFATSVNAGTTKKGYVFSTSPRHVSEFMSYVAKHDMAAATRMIKEKKVYPLKEGVDVVLVPVAVYAPSMWPSSTAPPPNRGGMVMFRLRSTPFGVFVQKGAYWTVREAITP